ncbi:MAG: hypothetical protein GXX99_06150 [Clostridiales bacterium]|nr:hypothetical protein [Clostridiales bacterium]
MQELLEQRRIEAAPPVEGVRVYHLTAAYPRLNRDGKGADRINRYYRALSAGYARRVDRSWRGPEGRRMRREGEDFSPRGFAMDSRVTLSDRHLFGLVRQRETPPAGPARQALFADCFDLKTGTPLGFDEVFVRPQAARETALRTIVQQLEQRARLPGSRLHRRAAKIAQRQFDRQCFWRDERGRFVFYYAPGLLADADVGPMQFVMPAAFGEKYYGAP